MHNIHLLILTVFILSLSGCATYEGAIYFHESEEKLEVKVDKMLRSGMSYMEARNAESGLLCTGSSRTMHASSTRFSCKGEDGKLVLVCNDGRHLMGIWNAENCSSGQGLGGDQFGNTFIFAYGTEREEIERKLFASSSASSLTLRASSAVNPLYTAMLGYDGEGGIYVQGQTPVEQVALPKAKSVAGFFISSDGRIITSAGILDGQPALSVYLPLEQRWLPASIISIDPENNTGVIKVDAVGEPGSEVRVSIKQNKGAVRSSHYKEYYH